MRTEEDQVLIEVEDEGEGFDPDVLPDPLTSENLLKPHGRGVLLMNRFMDDVRYASRKGGGTRVTLIKTISTRAEDSADNATAS